ncbi:MAG: zinc-dependent metalloprotease, partial [bacterium]
MKRTVLFMLTLFLLILVTLAPAFSQEKEQPSDKKSDKKKKEVFIDEKVKDFTVYDGLFTLYQNPKDGTTYLKIKKDQLGKEYIYFSHIQDGLVGTRHFRGQYRGSKIFTIKKYFDKLEFIAENTSYYFDESQAISRAKEANISHAILASQKIAATDSLKTEFLIKADPLFLAEDVAPVKPAYPKTFKGYKLGSLSKNKTKYVKIKSYPENTDVVVEYVYENKTPQGSPGAGATDSRFISTRVQHSWIAVPENDYQPRRDDPRIGFFMRQITDLTSTSATPYKDVIHRWHLKKKNPNAKLSRPVEPIVWWIENTTPKSIRGTIKDAVLQWNKAFEKAGFKNAVQVKVQPDDAEWDAGDIRYNVLRWTSSPRAPFGGYGPSFVNPRTGQILGADVMLEYSFLTNRLNFDNVFSTAALETEAAEFDREDQYCLLQNQMQLSNIFGLTAIKALGADDVQKSKLLEEAIYYLMLHEVGHTLGLNHNMKASQVLSPAEINNASLTRKKGLTGSVMDYPAINVAADRNKQGQYYTTRPGPYDLWAIEYGYSPGLADADKEAKRLSKIAARSTNPDLVFGNDADDMRSPGKAIDPRVNTGDMSSDAITFAIDRIELSKKVASELRDKFKHDGQSYQELRNAYFIMTGQHSTSLRVISR